MGYRAILTIWILTIAFPASGNEPAIVDSPVYDNFVITGQWAIARDTQGIRLIALSLLYQDAEIPDALFPERDAISPNGRWLLLNLRDGDHRLMDLQSDPKVVKVLNNVDKAQFADDSRAMTITFTDRSSEILALDPKELGPASHPYTPGWRAQPVEDNKLLLTPFRSNLKEQEVTFDTKVEVIAPFMPKTSRLPNEKLPEGVTFRPNRWVIIAESNRIHILDLHSDDPAADKKAIQHRPRKVKNARIAPDGRWVVFPQEDEVVLIDAEHGSQHILFGATPWGFNGSGRFKFHNADTSQFTRSENGKWLLYNARMESGSGVIGMTAFRMRLWNTERGGQPVMEAYEESLNERVKRWEFVFSQDSRWLAGFSQGEMRLWSLQRTMSFLVPDRALKKDVNGFTVSDDGKLAAVRDDRGGVRIWELDYAEPEAKVLSKSGATFGAFEFVPASHLLLAAGDNGVLIWDMGGQRYTRKVLPKARLLKWSMADQDAADEPKLVEVRSIAHGIGQARQGGWLYAWDVSQNKRLNRLIRFISLKNDRQWLLAQSNKNELVVWDLGALRDE